MTRQTQQLINLYYDTPTLALRDRGIALRLRKQGRSWLQTVKCAAHSSGALTSRPEWETAYCGHFDFSVIDADPIRRWLERPRVRNTIAPLFETNFHRITWRFEPSPNCALLLMLDRGWIVAKGRREAISEVEIELACDTHPDHIDELFRLAQSLGVRVPLLPALQSKAERGYRLYLDIPLTPRMACTPPLHVHDAPLQRFRTIVVECLEHLQNNHDGALLGRNEEFIHQMRVAARRLRAATHLFAPHLPESFASELLPPLQQLMTVLGYVRNLDVLLAEIMAPVMSDLTDEPRLAAVVETVTDQRWRAQNAAMRYLQSVAHARFVMLTTALLYRPPFANIVAEETIKAAPDHEKFSLFVSARLKYLRKKVGTRIALARAEDPASLHKLRIAIKHLRYAMEFLTPIVRKTTDQRLHRHLERMQDVLGQLNDLANAGLLLMQYAGSDAHLCEAVALVGDWHTSHYGDLLSGFRKKIRKLERMLD